MKNFFQKKRFFFPAMAFCLFTAVPALYSAPLVNDSSAGSIACPFPHNIIYPYGMQPTRYTQAQYAAAVSQFYVTWYSNFVTGSGSSTRVWWPDAGSGGGSNYETVSEGIGYGMLIAVEMADKTLFDGLDGYRKAHLDGNNLMNWICAGPTGTSCTGNAATDADQDMCLALYMAAYQWNNATYTTEANTVATGLMNTCFPSSRVTGGDSNTGVIYPDYCAPGWYRCFATKTGNAGWTNVVSWIYGTFCPALESQWTHGFVPNEINNDGTFHSCIALGSEGCNNHGYDASRWGWRMGTDYLWNGSNQGPISIYAHTIQAGVTANGYANYIQEYFNATDGNTATKAGTDGATSPCSHLQIGPALVGVMAGLPKNPVNQAFVDDTYDELARRLMANSGCVTLEYFQDTLGLMCLMVGTGNFPNMACSGCAAGTPPATPTPMPCFMLDDMEDDNLINSTNG
ncbi:MAG TPA: glycosyl hydrolase family 8, partial [bacterium]|nr:glycosyl hydrolase family 8 [bacterium]